ncbi:NADH-quinone oxidoreductase subunit H [Lujinxingia vulgaris]|uniref:NADH-quinone oxidoreductase subunit H n=1 Tax=Lujinxingia vulgaris TaxID=2600176 RepID=A0A5C6XGI3_9DELT|nr:complex I subunit 1 family protein [Lujinxingia vulgaris]TXD38543.1 NADH-quinone oxidoreductase subunit H [Lujinxingia vulgaris]
MMVEVLISLVKIFVIVLGFVMAVAGLLTLLGDRKQSSKIQNRVGPNRAKILGIGVLGIPHFLADGLKLVLKENIVPAGANRFLHTLAPALVLAPALIGWAVIPFMDHYCTGTVQTTAEYTEICVGGEWKNYFSIMHLNAGLLFAFAIAAISVYGAAIAGWASNSKYSLLGGLRSSAQMISYEVSMGLSLAGVLLIYGTLDLNEMARMQGYLLWDWLPMWGIVVQPLAFFLFFLAGMAETKRAPFDLPEGESEIVAGYLTEYSTMKFAGMQLAEYAATVFIAALIAVLFLGGWQIPYVYADGIRIFDSHWVPFGEQAWYWISIFLRVHAMIFKILVLVWLQFMMRWTLPRFRYDQVMTLGWKILLPLSIANLFVTALIVTLL